MDCQNCRLGYNISLNGRGPKGAKVMFIQDFPEPIDLKYNKQFAGKSCNSLLLALKNRGISEDEVYFTSIVKCPAYQGEEEIKPKDVKCCADLLETEISLINPKVIVPVGKQSLKYLIGVNTLTKSRGKAVEKEFKYTDEEGNITTINRIILPMVHPRQLKLRPIYKEYTLNDLDTLVKLVEEGMPKSDELHYEYLETVESVLQGIRDIQNNAEVIAFDIETNTLNAFQDDAKVLCISMSYKTHSGVCIPLQHKDSPFKDKNLELVLNALKELLENDTLKVAHNGKFDIKFLEAVLGIKVNNFNFDTQIAHYLAVSEERGTQGLKSLAWEYTNMGGYDNALDDYKKSLPTSKQGNYENIPWDILKEYAICDTDCTLRLYYIFQPLIEENPKWKIVMYDILMPASYTLKDVETNGMLFDVELGEKYLKEYAEEAERIQQALEEFPEVLEIVEDRKKKWMYREELKKIPKKDRTEEENIKFKEYAKYKNPEFNWSSVNQLRELFFDKLNLETSVKTDKGEYSTSAEALEEMQNQHEIPKLLTELRKINILNNFFITKFPELKDKNNIIHSTFNMTLTATGRMSSSDPNFQQIPRKVEDVTSFQYHHEVKSLFISRFKEEGCIANFDYSALEMKIAGIISGDANLRSAFLSGQDLHKSTASLIWNVPIEEVSKTLRTQAKAVNFGLIYGKTGVSFAKDFYYDEKGEDPEKFSDWGRAKQEGEKLVNDYLGTFSGLRDWLDNTKKFAHKHGYVETMFGRRRRLPNLKSQVHGMKADAERQAINAPIQGTGSDFTVMSLNQINDYFKKHGLKSMIIATVHDSIVFDIYIPELAEVAEVVKTIMESVHKPYIDTDIPVTSDIELGSNYGAVFDISLDECKSIKTVEDYNKWLAIQNREKYETEMKQLKKKGFTEIQVEKYLQKYNRPKDLLDFFKNLV